MSDVHGSTRIGTKCLRGAALFTILLVSISVSSSGSTNECPSTCAPKNASCLPPQDYAKQCSKEEPPTCTPDVPKICIANCVYRLKCPDDKMECSPPHAGEYRVMCNVSPKSEW